MPAGIGRIRRVQDVSSQRVVLAAFDRYRQVIATIAERCELGRSLGRTDVERSAAHALARLEARFPEFAKHADANVLLEPMDPVVAQAALSSLQARHNAEQASLAALRMEAQDSLARGSTAAPATADAAEDAGTADGASLKGRAAALWRRLGGTS